MAIPGPFSISPGFFVLVRLRAFGAGAPTHKKKIAVLNILANSCDFPYSLLDRNMNMQSTKKLCFFNVHFNVFSCKNSQ